MPNHHPSLTVLIRTQARLATAERNRDRQLALAYQRGASLRELSEATGIPVTSLRRLLADQGVTMRPRGR